MQHSVNTSPAEWRSRSHVFHGSTNVLLFMILNYGDVIIRFSNVAFELFSLFWAHRIFYSEVISMN